MISNQILQSTIDGLKSITRKELSVVEKEGKVIATTEENMIGRQIDADNVSYRNIKDMTDELARFGNLTIKRIYGIFTTDSYNSDSGI